MSAKQIRAEVLADFLETYGVKLPADQIATIANDFYQHIQQEREMESYAHIGADKKECEICKSLRSEIKDLERQISIYQNSVKERRNAERVWLEGDSVRYE